MQCSHTLPALSSAQSRWGLPASTRAASCLALAACWVWPCFSCRRIPSKAAASPSTSAGTDAVLVDRQTANALVELSCKIRNNAVDDVQSHKLVAISDMLQSATRLQCMSHSEANWHQQMRSMCETLLRHSSSAGSHLAQVVWLIQSIC